jgi:hypothetical protein
LALRVTEPDKEPRMRGSVEGGPVASPSDALCPAQHYPGSPGARPARGVTVLVMYPLLHVSSNRGEPVIVDHPDVVAVRTFALVPGYQFAAPNGARWLTLHELASPANVEPSGDGVQTVFEQISPAEGWLTRKGVAVDGPYPAGNAVLSVVMDVDRAAVERFHGWYEEEHLPTMASVPGVRAARRFRAVQGALPEPGRDRFLALYELERADVLSGDAWAGASTVTPRTEEVLPHLAWASQLYRLVV